jgi:hypothetical protein
MSERDKYLTEAMGEECWHEWVYCGESKAICTQCNTDYTISKDRNDFSTWEGFGKLWEFCKKQEWYYNFLKTVCPYKTDYPSVIHEDYIHPDRFADAVYEFLKERCKCKTAYTCSGGEYIYTCECPLHKERER